LALVLRASEEPDNVAETAVARVAMTAKTVVNFMINNEGRISRPVGSKEGGKIITPKKVRCFYMRAMEHVMASALGFLQT
jgi:hypothetical protein